MVLVLGGITLVAAAGLGFVYNATKGPIEAAKSAKTTGALAKVMPAFDNDPAADTVIYEIDGMPITVYTGRQGGQISGYAVGTMTKSGFSGEIRMMVGFDPQGKILNIEVLQQNETPGLGSKMADPGNVLLVSFQGKNPKDLKMSVRKDGGDIDVITASTISSRAYVDAVERGYRAFRAAAFGEAPAESDASSGATGTTGATSVQ
jgi:electron transport complex protein RnfG